VSFEQAHKELAEMHGWDPEVVGRLTPKQLHAYTRVTPGTRRTAKVGSVAEARKLCRTLRGE